VKIINSLKEIKFVELRIDYLEDLKNLDKIINSIEKKVILTNRIEKE
jgi:3-dehydroquinate dehydratase